MSLSVVNGYLCYSSCDAAKAAAGKNPHPHDDMGQKPESATSPTQDPAVVFGGTLTGRNAVAPTGAATQAGDTSGDPPPAGIDLQV